MSGIYIKDIAVPKSGYVDVRIFSDGRATTQTGERPFYREMDVLELPPHGRLIDADALTNRVGSYMPIKWTYEYGSVVSLNDIEHAPTIIPADHEEEAGEGE